MHDVATIWVLARRKTTQNYCSREQIPFQFQQSNIQSSCAACSGLWFLAEDLQLVWLAICGHKSNELLYYSLCPTGFCPRNLSCIERVWNRSIPLDLHRNMVTYVSHLDLTIWWILQGLLDQLSLVDPTGITFKKNSLFHVAPVAAACARSCCTNVQFR